MARGKNAAKKRGTGHSLVEIDRGVSPRSAVSGSLLPAVPNSSQAGSQAQPPPLGIVVMSNWGWRILAVFAMVAFGLCLTFSLDGHTVFGALWLFITASWGWFTYKLRLRHLAWDAEQ
jgi:hypothetical protein